MHRSALYGLALVLALYNLGVFLLLYYLGRAEGQVARSTVKKIINAQISADLLILTAMLAAKAPLFFNARRSKSYPADKEINI